MLYDDNHISIDGSTSLAYSDDVPTRFEAYHWHTQKVDGHDMVAIDAAIRAAQAQTERPSLIVCRTHIGLKSPLQDNSKVHGAPLGDENLAKTKEAYGWPVEPRFYVPEGVYGYFAQFSKQGAKAEADWQNLFVGYKKAYPDLAAGFERLMKGELTPGWQDDLPVFPADKPMATRVASGKVLDALAPHLPVMVGGSADLTPSNNTQPKGSVAVTKGDYSGAYIHFGVREHAMGGLMNGMVLHGMRAYGGTFLVFSDYMRPAIRLAAFMGLPVVYVFTHDSIGLGEDGPTHQPVEHVTALRAIPNLWVIRPADANETAIAWKLALERKDGPTALMLTRQNVPILTETGNAAAKGAYILADAENRKPQVVLVASGSEVSLAMEARQQLSKKGIQARVVSMPCWELFETQSKVYQKKVLPPDVPHISIEAGVTLAWNCYLGCKRGTSIGLDHFGASAPYQTLFEQYGFTVENIVRKVKKMLSEI